MKKLFFLFFLFVFPSVFAEESLTDIMKTELNRNFAILKDQPIPAYFISYRAEDGNSYRIQSSFGNVIRSESNTSRLAQIFVRVGDYSLDNTHESNPGGLAFFSLPFDNISKIKTQLWEVTDQQYKAAVRQYEQKKGSMATRVASTDKSPNFSKEKPEKHIEKPIKFESLNLNVKKWEEKIASYGRVFEDNKEIYNAIINFEVILSTHYLVDSEGSEIVENQVFYRIFANASTLAEDGMELPLEKSYFAHTPDDFPTDEEIKADLREMSKMINTLKNAPAAESYTGPAILSPVAAGVFFHEIFGHRVEGFRLKLDSDAQTFKTKVNETILPEDFSVTFDPQIKVYKGFPLSGGYKFDAEGVRGQKVEVVKNGVLKSFLMSRTPIEGFPNSNGHARGMFRQLPVTRQSNMLIETSSPKTEEALRDLLIAEAKKQNKTYGYYIDQVQGGFTNTNRYSPNAFNINPLVVYRIYVDGRPDELVRGVNLIGTPLAMFSHIEAAGKELGVFNGICGAESGTIPVSTVSPAIFVESIETQKKANARATQPLLERP